MFEKIGILGDIKETLENDRYEDDIKNYLRENAYTKARLADGYCTLPIQNGQPCSKIMSRWKCYHCKRYITTLADLDEHRRALKELEDTLENNIYGEHYAAHLISSITAISNIIKQLEIIQRERQRN